ncbi:hypothetical protein [Peterkaempfera bronchialis]|uniref:Uncharacterized protein n=1 Tax=Peterkaempfera bronchialis TaxID=2126346 RepID=A0A345SWZ5_9ACTN|nr:hypothetical protein [Peterkaempfera bronchialis]AXI78250.1 hypothetical protein C7M71_013170 [Peterkaempfera bronchialis]
MSTSAQEPAQPWTDIQSVLGLEPNKVAFLAVPTDAAATVLSDITHDALQKEQRLVVCTDDPALRTYPRHHVIHRPDLRLQDLRPRLERLRFDLLVLDELFFPLLQRTIEALTETWTDYDEEAAQTADRIRREAVDQLVRQLRQLAITYKARALVTIPYIPGESWPATFPMPEADLEKVEEFPVSLTVLRLGFPAQIRQYRGETTIRRISPLPHPRTETLLPHPVQQPTTPATADPTSDVIVLPGDNPPVDTVVCRAYWQREQDTWAHSISDVRQDYGVTQARLMEIIENHHATSPALSCPQCGTAHALEDRIHYRHLHGSSPLLCHRCTRR